MSINNKRTWHSGKPVKKPDYDPESITKELVSLVVTCYNFADSHEELHNLDKQKHIGRHKSLQQVVIDLKVEGIHLNPIKVRKILITAGVYESPKAAQVSHLHTSGKSIPEIMSITGLSYASVHSYLPYSKIIYKLGQEGEESSVGADREKLYRQRKRSCDKLQRESTEENLWNCIVLFQKYPFHTASGLPYTYKLKEGRNGELTRELWIDRREQSKSLAWSSVKLAFQNAMGIDHVIDGPKALGDIRGISYIYPLLWRFGVIQVPEKIERKMDSQPNRKKE